MLYKSFVVPIRFTASHGFNELGFRSDRKGVFATMTSSTPAEYIKKFSGENLSIFNIALEKFEIGEPVAEAANLNIEWQSLSVTFVSGQTGDFLRDFVWKIAAAMSTSIASSQRDASYGNLYMDVDWFCLNMTEETVNGDDITSRIRVTDSIALEIIQFVPLNNDRLTQLQYSAYTELFFEGIRATHPKAKYISWFVLLEELEKLDEFNAKFTPMFSKADQPTIVAATVSMDKQLQNRLKQMLTNPNLHRESRPEKLLVILNSIGITYLTTMHGTVQVDVALCKSLIETRNSVAHKGQSISEGQLYNVLFPLAFEALRYLNDRQQPNQA